MYKRLFSLLILIAFAAAIQYFWGWGVLLQPWQSVPLATGLLIVLLLLSSYAARALRLHDYYRQSHGGKFTVYLKIILYHNLLNNMLPMRSGELSFPFLMARYCQVPPMHSVPTLIWFRFLDLHIVCTLAIVAASLSFGPGSLWLWLVLPWLPIPIIAYFAQYRLRNYLSARDSGRWRDWLAKVLAALPAGQHTLWRSIGWSWLNWLVKIAVLAEVLRYFLPVAPSVAWLGAIGGDLTSVLPVHAPGGFGTYEAGVVAAMAPFEVDLAKAVPAAVNLHLFMLSGSILGAIAALALPIRQR